LARLHAGAFADPVYRSRDLTSRRERQFRPLLILAPAQKDVEEVERRPRLDHDLTRLRAGLLDLGELERLLRVSESLHLPGSYADLPHGPL
jgi:hypothetical protein